MEEDQVSEVQISMVRLFDTDLGDDSSSESTSDFCNLQRCFSTSRRFQLGAGTI
jgi:hypothetical protein